MGFYTKFGVTVALLVVSMAGGWLARRRGWVHESAARSLMSVVAVFGYSSIGMLSIWTTPLGISDIWLPVLGATYMIVLTLVGLAIGRFALKSTSEIGLLGLAGGISNLGPTMGGFVVFLFYGEPGLGLVGVLTLMFVPMVVLWGFPIARHYSPSIERMPLLKLYATSLLSWRSLGVPIMAAGVVLSVLDVPRPRIVAEWYVVDVMVFALVAAAYFSIGLRLRGGDLWVLRKPIALLAGIRFVGGLVVMLALLAITQWTPWPLGWDTLGGRVLFIEGFVPTAVSMVAVANMFHLAPRKASALFVANTLMYLVLILPWVVLFMPHR
ncbi:MAG: AEC family transporter [Phycisphaerae bacterium]